MDQTGARLVEVGTTNITTIDDFRRAVTPETAMIFSAHQSNYKITGFTQAPTLSEMASLRSGDIIFARDLGSGNLVSDQRLPANFEPTIVSELKQGADIICFSGDKLLGACQAGVIIGKKEYIARLRKNPLMRMIRVDKMTYFILQECLLLYENGRHGELPLWKTIFQDKNALSAKRDRILRRVKHPRRKEYLGRVETRAAYGGGSMPAVEIPSLGITVSIPGVKADAVFNFFIKRPVPVLGVISGDILVLDMMTVLERDIPSIAEAVDDLLGKEGN
jgi:L-seryl-tRNA(Ser) seleniumtransferase